jgi:hypothetical protein
MKPLNDAFLTDLEKEAREWVKELSALRTYQGSDSSYMNKGKLAVALIGGLARMRASESNRMAIELATTKLASSLPEAGEA